MLRVGLVGCGAIGSILAEAIDSGKAGDTKLIGIFDISEKNAFTLQRKLRNKCAVAHSLEELLSADADVIVEAASQKAVREYGEKILRSGRDMIVLSVGALLDKELLSRMLEAAERGGARIRVPTGAVLAVDALKAASIGGIESVELITIKPPHALGVKAARRSVVFEGAAKEAVKRFPQNINVAATLSLAGIGEKKTKVRIIADPKLKRNIHELRVKAASGSFQARIENVPSPDNPKTSYIAALSAMRLLKDMSERLRIGT